MTTTRSLTAQDLRRLGLYAKDGDAGTHNPDGTITTTRRTGTTSKVAYSGHAWRTVVEPTPPAPKRIDGPHCQQCGSTDTEDLWGGDQGYTACCNELVAYADCTTYNCSHN